MKIHFIGIGGIGVSALAQYYLKKGHQISGSDLTQSEITNFLQKKGVNILMGNKAGHITLGINMVIYSPAVKPDNEEFAEAKKLGIVLKSYPEALGELTRQYATIAISGSHGKSTTTAMIALVLIEAGLDPTVIVGTKLKEFGNPALNEAEGSNFRMGTTNFLVIEACEYDASFANYFPKIAVITNVDKEHLDYFKTFANVKKAFRDFAKKLPTDGVLVINGDDKNLVKISHSFSSLRPRAKRGGKQSNTRLPRRLRTPRNDGEGFSIKQFSIQQKEASKLKKILQIPGQHNVSNALAVLAIARIFGIKDEITFKALSKFKGTWRRFEIKTAVLGSFTRIHADKNADSRGKRKITIVSDYGHHPAEVLATLKAAREKYPRQKIWCIFQPHQYQRTYYLFNDFVKLFKKVPINNIIITDIYDVAGREEKNINQSVNSEKLVKKIAKKNVQYMSLTAAETFVKEHIKSGEVLIIMGAGDVYRLAEKF
ncbi:MAG: UDP-N-acetylmuramate--L-alanine ligase [Candidatus Staskawiczbacteria bacterium RIFCSPHIGHO2_02_FULL_42_22]|uniref:UDP-N-acetylmuramate--L-alanine ligase n=1 Tax=Candidatus Staskawiczbacteria bacterium RIFCSPHIGHO2_02_FULL_42_22 TaxID=1802207 RepID=A0A1G2I519_9BACT|nr:MAG: UDP-N-acetylmuramate--L-alanine ligase [Candidatus Staskawiczbacteria bacterium RIFCSPHIGHO2_02_FULL_42_22]